MTEFTGERVIPGQVNADLWAEHIARYAFAARFSAGKRVLDAGCGAGYGCNQLADRAAFVAGIDVSTDAISYARAQARSPNLDFVQASILAIPFGSESFHLVTAFEVIEHLEDWRGLLSEVRRVLHPQGLFLVSTPNRLYYAESRAQEGPNPYHVHEFEFEEFRAALAEFFPYSTILLQNRLESFAFHGAEISAGVQVRVEHTAPDPAHANFFLGVCAKQPIPDLHTFLYVPQTVNLLREREQHIHLLQQELALTRHWLEQNISDHAALQQEHQNLSAHLDENNRWARELEKLWRDAQQRVVQLQTEFANEQANAAAVAEGYARKVSELEQENLAKTNWAIDTEARLTADLAQRAGELAATVRLLDTAEATIVERTHWGQKLTEQLQLLRAQLDMIRESRWVRLGRVVGLGPDVSRR